LGTGLPTNKINKMVFTYMTEGAIVRCE